MPFIYFGQVCIESIDQPFAINKTTVLQNIKFGASYSLRYNNDLKSGTYARLNSINVGTYSGGGIFYSSSFLNKYSYYKNGLLIESDWDNLFMAYYNGFGAKKHQFLTFQRAEEYQFAIGLIVTCKPNENFFQFHRGLMNVLDKMTLYPTTIEYRENSGMSVYPIYKEDFSPIYLRNQESLELLIEFSEVLVKSVYNYELTSGGNSLDYLQKFSFGKVWTPYGNAFDLDVPEGKHIIEGGYRIDCNKKWWDRLLSFETTYGNKFVLGDIYFMLKMLPNRGQNNYRNHGPVFYFSPIEPKNKILYSCYDPEIPNPADAYADCSFCEYKLKDGSYYHSNQRIWHLISTMDEISQISKYSIKPRPLITNW